MKDTLTTGIEDESTYTVTEEMAPPHLPVKVLSTPSMVRLIETACHRAVESHLEESEVTVGTHICVSHVGAVMAGQQVSVECELEKIDGRRLDFRVAVHASGEVISEGTHQRAVMDARRFGAGGNG